MLRLFPLSSSQPKRPSLATGLALLGCAMALSACNTTSNNGEAIKTALVSPASDAGQNAGEQTANAAQSGDVTNTAGRQAAVAANAAGTKAGAEAAGAAQAATSLAADQTGARSQAPTLNAEDAGKARLQAQALAMAPVADTVSDEDQPPVFSGGIPVPAERGQMQPAMAFAAAKAEASPASLAADVAFVTPPTAPRDIDLLIAKYSEAYNVPERLVRRVVHRESRFNPAARNGPYYGLMQISHPTARGMGYKGPAKGLLDAETNLKYAVRYLSGAYKVAGGDENQAVRLYARGYYYDAKRKGLLRETGLDGSFRNGPTREAAARMETAADDTATVQPAALPGVKGNVVPAAKPAVN